MIGFVVLFMFVVSTTLAIYKPPLKWVSGCLIVYVPMWHHQLTYDFVSQIRIQVSNPIIILDYICGDAYNFFLFVYNNIGV